MEGEGNDQKKGSEEIYFLKLFYRVLTLMANVGRDPGEEITDEMRDEIESGIEEIKRRFIEDPEGTCDPKNFNTLVRRQSWFYWSSPLAAGVTREKTLIALQNCEAFRLSFYIPSLKVVSIGAGPGSDLVGLFSALHEHFERTEDPQPIFQEMELLLIDNNIKWEPYFQNIVKSLRHPNTDFGNAREWMRNRNITTSFICADLRQLTNIQQRELSNAHIVWMKSIMVTLQDNNVRRSIANEIVSSMSSGALLVFIDSPSYERYVRQNASLDRIFSTMENGEGFELSTDNPENELKYASGTNKQISIFKKK